MPAPCQRHPALQDSACAEDTLRRDQLKARGDLASSESQPYQFRTRNNLINTQRTRSNAHEIPVKSTKLIDILQLITVWMLVRVLGDIFSMLSYANRMLRNFLHVYPSQLSSAATAASFAAAASMRAISSVN